MPTTHSRYDALNPVPIATVRFSSVPNSGPDALSVSGTFRPFAESAGRAAGKIDRELEQLVPLWHVNIFLAKRAIFSDAIGGISRGYRNSTALIGPSESNSYRAIRIPLSRQNYIYISIVYKIIGSDFNHLGERDPQRVEPVAPTPGARPTVGEAACLRSGIERSYFDDGSIRPAERSATNAASGCTMIGPSRCDDSPR